MTELGICLKEARIGKGYSLDDLQEKTKIQKRYLSAIEEGNYSVMPGTFYVRAFIKQYAEAVDLDANELFETYKSELPTNKVADHLGTGASVSQASGSNNNSSSSSRRRSAVAKSMGPNKKFADIMPKVVIALFIIIIIAVVAILKFYQPNNDVDNSKAPVTQENKNVEDTAKEKAAADEAAKKKAAKEAAAKKKAADKAKQKLSKGVVGSDGITTTYQLTDTKKLDVRVEITGPIWLGITDENGATLGESGMFAAGDEVKVDAKDKKSVRIRLGAAAAAKIFINDEEVKLVTPASEKPTQNIEIKLAEEQ
ncbi:helix-turn-helix domain-containing protein [Kurthia sibirica]|uniref:DUF4115 domain-containing protein n=1 Tax=Kurthia sibirica TaxID=202750 RepID=A0A2U3AR31_9BACL|nr:helix-turn-helix domain-containing protein [Kurthia sibirica]PWI26956.1 DUF4115 domain-containing protein [Kurthia sibirica]GEK32498.1 XRE family transcriptional regulator [Kurthia sibirica]